MSAIIEVDALVKQFGTFTAVDGVNFQVMEGEIFGFLGPNGAGKTTTINILATLLPATSGTATLAGFDVRTQPNQVRQAIGMMFQDASLDDRLTAEENLTFHAMLYNVPRKVRAERMDQMLDIVGLADRRTSLVRTFSGGMKRRLEIARGLLHYPAVLFLDEPTVGLDPQTRNAIWEHVQHLRKEIGTTVFMTTHYLDEAENCDRIAIIDQGKIQAVDTPEALKRRLGGDVIVVTGDTGLRDELATRYGVQIQEADGAFRFQAANGAEFVPRVVMDFKERIRTIQIKQPSLDDVFLQLTGRAIRAEEGTELERMRQGKAHVDGKEITVHALMVVYTIWLREFKAFLRERSRIVAMIGQPLLYLLIVGQGIASGLSLNGAPANVGYLTFMYPGILGMSVLFTSIFSAISIIWDREFGFLKEVLVAPVPRWAVALGKILGGATVAIVQSAILIALAPFVHVSLSFALIVQLLFFCFLISIAITSLGVFVAVRMRSMQGFQMLMNFLVMPMYFLSGAMFPIRSAPGWMKFLMTIDPLTYGVDALRNVVFAGVDNTDTSSLVDMARANGLIYSTLAFDGPVMILVALALTAAACIHFSWAQK